MSRGSKQSGAISQHPEMAKKQSSKVKRAGISSKNDIPPAGSFQFPMVSTPFGGGQHLGRMSEEISASGRTYYMNNEQLVMIFKKYSLVPMVGHSKAFIIPMDKIEPFDEDLYKEVQNE